MNEKKYLTLFTYFLVGIGLFILYVHRIKQVFESRTNFVHLTLKEKELLFREDALYFRFYATIVEEKNFWEGYQKLLNYTNIEYNSSINVVNRFHVLPEIFISYFYHQFKYMKSKTGLLDINYWTTENRSDIKKLNNTCDNVDDSLKFYFESLWIFGGFSILILYMYGSFLSENLFGGIYAVVLYIIFHKNASKIYERPAARENFAFPFIFWQIFYLTICIKKSNKSSSKLFKIFMILKLVVLITVSLLCWQFSSIIFAMQILLMMTPWSINYNSTWLSRNCSISYFISSIVAFYFSYYNKKFIISWQNGPALALLSINFFNAKKTYQKSLEITSENIKGGTLGIFYAFSFQGFLIDLLEKTGVTNADDNPFIVYRDLILYWSLKGKSNFTTRLLGCHSDYKETNVNEIWELIKILFIKPYCLYGIVILAKFFRNWRKTKNLRERTSEQKERAKNYIFEDFMEENRITIKEMTNKETKLELNSCFRLLEKCNYDYELYKKEKNRFKRSSNFEHENFMNDIRKLKNQIKEKRGAGNFNEKKGEYFSERDNVFEKCNFGRSNIPSTENTTHKDDNIPISGTQNKKKIRKKDKILDNVNLHYIFSVGHLIIFIILGLSVKKLFFLCFTQGCVIASSFCSKFWNKKQNIFWTISLLVFLTTIIDPGINNVQLETLPETKTNDDLLNMIQWIKFNTDEDSVFAGPFDIIGTIHLTTQRPIVNHAHLDMRQISGRTEKVYSVFSRQDSSEIFNYFTQLKIQYFIMAFKDCNYQQSSNECDMLTIWDELQPTLRKYPQFCAELLKRNIPSFLKIYSNRSYLIIKMFSHSVQVHIKNNKMLEKVM